MTDPDGSVRGNPVERGRALSQRFGMTNDDSLNYFRTSREIIRLAVMMYMRFPLSLRNVEDLLHERGIDISHESVRFWWNRPGPLFAAEIRKKRAERLRSWPQWQVLGKIVLLANCDVAQY